MPGRQGAIRLFRLAGIDVFLHWSWFVVAVYEVQDRLGEYSNPVWAAGEYLALFLIVALHEFGHALACRQAGGTANEIVLWPLGGVAYVKAPPRPGPTLWSLAAGPLVNVVLTPILLGASFLARSLGAFAYAPNLVQFLAAVAYMNIALLIFNVLPIYPLDGGQIFRSLLWFVFGKARSLYVAVFVGFLGVAALGLLAMRTSSSWTAILAAFVAINCWSGYQQARALSRMEALPRHRGFACPSCKTPPPIGPLWACPSCRTRLDPFEGQPTCPACGTPFPTTTCPDCGRSNPIGLWAATPGSTLP